MADSDFAFLKKWGATVDLTLIVNDQAGINPGVSIIDPLKQIVTATKGTFSQSFSLGLGGGVTGQANLNDAVSFSLSLAELNSDDTKFGGIGSKIVRDRYYNECIPFQEGDLIGKLRLKEWVDQTLVPASGPEPGHPLLTRGRHPVVKKGGGDATIAKEAAKTAAALEQVKSNLSSEKPVQPKAESGQGTTTASPPANQTKSQQDIAQEAIEMVKPENLSKNPGALGDYISKNEAELKNIPSVIKPLKHLQVKITGIQAAEKNPPKNEKKLNDPLDTISHQVQFIVTWTASATPSWSLAQVKGPGPATGSFLSGQRQTTHQLLITMGPISTMTGQPNGDVQAVRATQQFSAALQRLQIGPLQ